MCRNCDSKGGPVRGWYLVWSVIVWNSIKAGAWGPLKVFLIRQWVSAGQPAGSTVQSHRHKHIQGHHIFPSVTHLGEGKQSGLSHNPVDHPLIKSLCFGEKKGAVSHQKGRVSTLPIFKKIWVKVFQNKPTQNNFLCGDWESVWSCFFLLNFKIGKTAVSYKQNSRRETQYVYVKNWLLNHMVCHIL